MNSGSKGASETSAARPLLCAFAKPPGVAGLLVSVQLDRDRAQKIKLADIHAGMTQD